MEIKIIPKWLVSKMIGNQNDSNMMVSKMIGNQNDSKFLDLIPNILENFQIFLEMISNWFQIIWKISKIFGNSSKYFGFFPTVMEIPS